MARCTAPVYGHRTASGAAACPACGGRYGRYSGNKATADYGSYSSPSYSSSGAAVAAVSEVQQQRKAAWSRAGSSVVYTPAEVRALTPVRESIERRAPLPDPRDVFLCHAWDDRGGAAKELHDLLESRGVSVWFSEKDVAPRYAVAPRNRQRTGEVASRDRAGDPCAAAPPPRRGYRRQRAIGTPSADLLVPIVHGTTYEALREVSPLLGSRSGLNTTEDTMANVAAKLAELVAI